MGLIEQVKQEEREDLIARIDADTAAEPCGCPDCNNGVQPGHFACSQPSAAMLRAEAEGLVARHYTDERADGTPSLSSAWRWFAV